MKKIAVIGAGYWGKNLIRNFYQLGVLGAICDVDLKIASNNKKIYPDIDFFTDYEHILKNDNISAIVIALPCEDHYKNVMKALKHNKDVLVEKPLALKIEHAEELIDLAEKQNRILMVGHLMKYHNAYIKLIELVRQGVLGKIRSIRSIRGNSINNKRSENAIWSFAPHDISMILGLMEEIPQYVSARFPIDAYLNKKDEVGINLLFGNEIQADMNVSWNRAAKEQNLMIVGHKQVAVFDDICPWNKKLALYPVSQKCVNELPFSGDPEYIEVINVEPLRKECEHFVKCINSQKRPKTNGQEGLDVLKILAVINESYHFNSAGVSQFQITPLEPNYCLN
jgi:UDP-2-acetamido-3-amino-2,3-dideoxy-glucuronate N-acetyltransferase